MKHAPVDYIELNLSNYSDEDVAQLNEWSIWAAVELEKLGMNLEKNSDDGVNVDDYQARVIELFKSGNATDRQWKEMAAAVLFSSENDGLATECIDRSIIKEYE